MAFITFTVKAQCMMDNYPAVAKIQQFYLGRSELGNKLAIQLEGGHCR